MNREDGGLKKMYYGTGLRHRRMSPMRSFLHKSSSSSRNKQIIVLSRAVRSLLEPLSRCTGTGFEVKVKKEKVRRCFPRVLLYCFDIPGAQDMSSIRLAAGRYHRCVRSRISFETIVNGRTRPNRSLAETTEARRQVQSLKEIAGTVSDRG